jgi:hypothetical protein
MGLPCGKERKTRKEFSPACVEWTLLSAALGFAAEFAVYIGAQPRRIIQPRKSKFKGGEPECPPHPKKKKGTIEACPFHFLSDSMSPW